MGQRQQNFKQVDANTRNDWYPLFPSIYKASDNTYGRWQLIEYVCHCSLLSNLVYEFTSVEMCHTILMKTATSCCWFRPIAFSLSSPSIQVDGPSYVVVEFEKFRVLAVRGTKQFTDWKSNVNLGDECLGELNRLHQGFCGYAKDIPTELIYYWNGEAKDIIRSQKPLLFTGHSLGGAVAEIAALPLIIQDSIKVNQVLVFTFGSPSIVKSNQEWTKKYKEKLLDHIYRFYWEDDVVSISTHMSDFVAIERLIKLEEVGFKKTESLESKFLDSLQNMAQETFNELRQSHSMNRYLSKLSVSEKNFAYPITGIPIPNIEVDEIKSLIRVPNSIEMALTERDGRRILVIQGKESFLSVCRASLNIQPSSSQDIKTIKASSLCYFIDQSTCLDDIGQESIVKQCEFICEFDITDITLNQGSVITQNNSTGIILKICTGFDVLELDIPQLKVGFKNVAVLGITGSGKTHLIHALCMHADGQKQLEVFKVSNKKATDEEAASFISGDKRVYELPGVDVANQTFFSKLHQLFSTENFPPSLVIITWKKGMKDPGGLHESIKKLKLHNPDLKYLLVLTRSPPESYSPDFIRDLKKDIEMDGVDHMMVNSAHEDFNNTHIPPQGIPELWERITLLLSSAPPPPTVRVMSIWESIYYNVASYLSASLLFAVVGVRLLTRGG